MSAATASAIIGSASTTVTSATAYEAKIDIVAAPAWAENGFRPARATGTTNRADDTLTTPTETSSVPSERPSRAGRSAHPSDDHRDRDLHDERRRHRDDQERQRPAESVVDAADAGGQLGGEGRAVVRQCRERGQRQERRDDRARRDRDPLEAEQLHHSSIRAGSTGSRISCLACRASRNQ